MDKFILDACCGGRMFWFNKQHPNTLYVDIRSAEKGHIGGGFNPNHEVKPDILADFRNLPFEDKKFKLVVFDPPHISRLRDTSIIGKKYGVLNKDSWREDILAGWKECYRVLEDFGVLIFKWGETETKISEVLKLFPIEPLFGHPSRSQGTTHWVCFMKIPNEAR